MKVNLAWCVGDFDRRGRPALHREIRHIVFEDDLRRGRGGLRPCRLLDEKTGGTSDQHSRVTMVVLRNGIYALSVAARLPPSPRLRRTTRRCNSCGARRQQVGSSQRSDTPSGTTRRRTRRSDRNWSGGCRHRRDEDHHDRPGPELQVHWRRTEYVTEQDEHRRDKERDL